MHVSSWILRMFYFVQTSVVMSHEINYLYMLPCAAFAGMDPTQSVACNWSRHGKGDIIIEV